MARDAQEHELTGASAAAANQLDQAIRAFTLNYGDVNASLLEAEKSAPGCAMIQLFRGWLAVLSNDPPQVARARTLVDQLEHFALNEREGAHLGAFRAATEGRWATTVEMLDRLLMDYPHDLAAHQIAMRFDGYQGRFSREAGRAARALPFWSRDQPGYGILLSFYGFGLEESGDFARAEDISRQAAELEPYGYWPHHAVSHILEMTGRPSEGLAWMEQRQNLWSTAQHTNRVHIWWHKALFHVELGEFESAMRLYDNEISATLRPIGTSLCNPTALLWRLETLGCDSGERWRSLCEHWRDRADGKTSPFNDVHAAITALRAGDEELLGELLDAMRSTSGKNAELAPAYRQVAVPVVEAMVHFNAHRYQEAVEHLLPVRAELWRLGGSIAQRDIVEWTLTEAAIRANLFNVSQSLANERLSLRPHSAINRRFQDHARIAKGH